MIKVKYVGKEGFSHIPGVANEDHECSEEEAYQRVASGLFEFKDPVRKDEMDALISESLYYSDPDAEIDEEATAKMQATVERKVAKEPEA